VPINTTIADETWARFAYLRENGHRQYMDLAKRCEDFFAGCQWDPRDIALLKATRRPALTINKILRTVSNVLGEQIFNRTDISFRPRNEGATSEVADALDQGVHADLRQQPAAVDPLGRVLRRHHHRPRLFGRAAGLHRLAAR
jgi:hypothetical protein